MLSLSILLLAAQVLARTTTTEDFTAVASSTSFSKVPTSVSGTESTFPTIPVSFSSGASTTTTVTTFSSVIPPYVNSSIPLTSTTGGSVDITSSIDKTTSLTSNEDTTTISTSSTATGSFFTTSSTTSSPTTSTSTTSSTTSSPTTSTSTTSSTTSSPTTSTSTTSSTTSSPTTSTSTTSSSSSSSSASSSQAKLSSVPTAIVYSPYNDDSSCKNSATVLKDLTLIKSAGIPKIRVYGTDCSSIQTIEPNALSLGLKINQGFWISSAGVDSIDDGVNELIAWGKANTWDVFDYITIGNEAVLAGYVTVDELIAKIASVRAKLEAAGYTGKITTAEPPVTFETYPSLCNDAAIDFVGVNPHAYFDTYSTAETAGDFVKGQVDIVKNICSKEIVVAETGYPSAGKVNGGNVPSPENQRIAIEKILEAMNNEVTILTTYNDLWKDPGPYGIEQSFGTIQFWT